jgi:hypothetical protein
MKSTHLTSTLGAAAMLSLCLPSLLIAADVGIKNGDFATGKQFWRGDGTVTTLPDGNKVLEMNSTLRNQSEVHQDIRISGWARSSRSR